MQLSKRTTNTYHVITGVTILVLLGGLVGGSGSSRSLLGRGGSDNGSECLRVGKVLLSLKCKVSHGEYTGKTSSGLSIREQKSF